MSESEIWAAIHRLEGLIKNPEQSPETAMINYATTSTIVGWSAFTNKELSYGLSGLNGKFCRVHVYLNGTSNATGVTFTLPFAASNIAASWAGPIRVQDNGGAFGWGLYSILAGGTTVTVYSTPGGAGWTGSGNKVIEADFWYELL
jgi:hypothetical protein